MSLSSLLSFIAWLCVSAPAPLRPDSEPALVADRVAYPWRRGSASPRASLGVVGSAVVFPCRSLSLSLSLFEVEDLDFKLPLPCATPFGIVDFVRNWYGTNEVHVREAPNALPTLPQLGFAQCALQGKRPRFPLRNHYLQSLRMQQTISGDPSDRVRGVSGEDRILPQAGSHPPHYCSPMQE